MMELMEMGSLWELLRNKVRCSFFITLLLQLHLAVLLNKSACSQPLHLTSQSNRIYYIIVSDCVNVFLD